MFRLAHISDVHLSAVPRPRFRDLFSKRVVGYDNWWRNRAHSFTADTLNRLVADLKEQAPDHIAVTGDLTNIAMREEFENARRWLDGLGPPDLVTAIPGNHDAYVPGAHHRYRTLWAPLMLGDKPEFVDKALFPFMRRKGHVALIGVSSAVASAPFMATGHVGSHQTERLMNAPRRGARRRALPRHPHPSPAKTHRIRATSGESSPTASAFAARSSACGAELILHGHDHIRMMTAIKGASGIVPVVGVPAASGSIIGGARAGGYAIHEIAENGPCYELTVIHRGFRESGEIVETARIGYSVNRP